MIRVSREELAELHGQAVDAAMMLALTDGAFRYLARAAGEVVTDDLACVLELISLALCGHGAADSVSDRIDDLMKREDAQ